MEPVFHPRQTLLVSFIPYLFRTPQINEIIVLQSPKDGRFIVKRIRKTKDNDYFVMGDNEKESTDSREFGWITKKEIMGKVVVNLGYL